MKYPTRKCIQIGDSLGFIIPQSPGIRLVKGRYYTVIVTPTDEKPKSPRPL